MKWNEKVDWAFDETWEKRKVFVLEGISKLPQYAYGKRVLFIDKEIETKRDFGSGSRRPKLT